MLSGKCTAEGGKTVYTGSDWKPVSYTTADGEKKLSQSEQGMR